MKRSEIERLKVSYPKGTIVVLNNMEGEPQMKSGLLGKVDHVDGIGQIQCDWENGSKLALNYELDSFSKLSNMKKIQLFLPLTIRKAEEDGYLYLTEETIETSLIKNKIDEFNKFLPINGLVEYMKEGELKNKLICAVPTIDYRNGDNIGLVNCYINEDLTKEEIENLKEYLLGQMSDGWGESFEQEPIKIDEDEYYISFWSRNTEYYIVTEEELILMNGYTVPTQ